LSASEANSYKNERPAQILPIAIAIKIVIFKLNDNSARRPRERTPHYKSFGFKYGASSPINGGALPRTKREAFWFGERSAILKPRKI